MEPGFLCSLGRNEAVLPITFPLLEECLHAILEMTNNKNGEEMSDARD